MPLVRENLLLLLWVFPAIVVFFGALAIGCTFCCKRKPSWQKVPASWMTGCVFLQAPCIFIFASFWFVLIMFWADACQGFPNVAMQYVDGLQDDLCTEIANGALTPRARFVCVVLCVCVLCVSVCGRSLLCCRSFVPCALDAHLLLRCLCNAQARATRRRACCRARCRATRTTRRSTFAKPSLESLETALVCPPLCLTNPSILALTVVLVIIAAASRCRSLCVMIGYMTVVDGGWVVTSFSRVVVWLL